MFHVCLFVVAMTLTFILTGNNSWVQHEANLSCALCQEGCSILNLERPRFRSRAGLVLYSSAEDPLGSGVSISGVQVGSWHALIFLGIAQIPYSFLYPSFVCCCLLSLVLGFLFVGFVYMCTGMPVCAHWSCVSPSISTIFFFFFETWSIIKQELAHQFTFAWWPSSSRDPPVSNPQSWRFLQDFLPTGSHTEDQTVLKLRQSCLCLNNTEIVTVNYHA